MEEREIIIEFYEELGGCTIQLGEEIAFMKTENMKKWLQQAESYVRGWENVVNVRNFVEEIAESKRKKQWDAVMKEAETFDEEVLNGQD